MIQGWAALKRPLSPSRSPWDHGPLVSLPFQASHTQPSPALPRPLQLAPRPPTALCQVSDGLSAATVSGGMGAGVPQVFLGPSPPQHPTLPSAHPWAAWPSPSLTPSFRAGHLGVALIPFSSLSTQVPWSCHSLLCPKTSLPSSKHIAKCPGPLGLLGPTSPHGQGPPPLSASQSGLLQPSVTDGGGA